MGMKKFLCAMLGVLWILPSWAALPAGYTELEYIESTGTQYINTGVLITENGAPWSWQIKVNFSELSQYMGSNGNIMLMYDSSEDGFMAPGSSGTAIPYTLNTDLIAEMQLASDLRRSIVINGVTSTGSNASTFTNPIYLMGYSGASTGNLFLSKGKLYYSRMYSNGTLVQDLVPAKNASGVVGMYDTVSNTFFTNAGTGEFIAGPIACDGQIVTYTSATGTVTQNGTPTPTNPIEPVFYTQGNMVLRKVGDYADTYDATTGKITRRVGVKVLDGTEHFTVATDNSIVLDGSTTFWNVGAIPDNRGVSADAEAIGISNYFVAAPASSGRTDPKISDSFSVGSSAHTVHTLWIRMNGELSAAEFKSWLAAQKAAGTPVIIYYPLETETTEDWPASYCETPIKIASTKYVETQFSALNTALANAVATVNTVVTQTIAQAASIATLQSGKQTRPADNTECPAYKQCLLVEDENGTPHWYEIFDPVNDFISPILANNIAPTSVSDNSGFTQLEYIESTGTQYIDTGIIATNWDWSAEFEMSVPQAGDMFFGAGSGIWSYTNWGAQFGLANSSGNMNWGAGSDGMNVVISVLGVRTDTFYNYKITKEGLYVNGELKSQNTATESFSNSDLSLWICKTNNTGASGYNNSASSWKYVRIYNANNALVFNGIPAKRNSDSAIGMYDTVTKTFFTNAGSGTFTAGPVVANDADVPGPKWTATWTNPNGFVYGGIFCSHNYGTTVGSIETNDSFVTGNTGPYCWCKTYGFKIDGQDVPFASDWVNYSSFSDKETCYKNCANRCAQYIRQTGFRNALLTPSAG